MEAAHPPDSIVPAGAAEPPPPPSTPTYLPENPSPAFLYAARAPGVGGGSVSSLHSALLVVLFLVAVCGWAGGRRRRGKQHGLAGALASRGWVLYTRPGCPYCAKQYEALGLHAQAYPKQVVCRAGGGGGVCGSVPGYPFWANERTAATRTGLQGAEQLKEMIRSSDGPGA